MNNIPSFVEYSIELENNGFPLLALESLFLGLDELLKSEEWDKIDMIFFELLDFTPENVSLGILTYTKKDKDKFQNREDFIKRIKKYLGYSTEKTNKLFKGIE